MKKLLFIFGLLALTAHAETVDIGGTQINLPSLENLLKSLQILMRYLSF